MYWLYFLLLGILVVSMYWGLKTGLFVAAIYGVGILVGWRIAGEISQTIGGIIGDTLGLESSSGQAMGDLSSVNMSVDTTTTVIAYVVVFILTLIITKIIIKLIAPFLAIIDVATLGLNRIAGIILGLVVGIIITSVTVSGLTRLAYDFHEFPNIPGSSLISNGEITAIEGIDAKIENTRTSIENALLESTITPIFVRVLRITPNDAFGIIPTDYSTAISILNSKLE